MTLRGWDALAAHIKSHPVAGTPARRRRAFAELAPEPVTGAVETIGEVSCLVVGNSRSGLHTIWVHGGGVVFGSPQSHSAMAGDLPRRLGTAILLPEYRLAPEYRWPAPLDDLLQLVDALAGPVRLIGDSAGGQLALLAVLRRPTRVTHLALLSPNTERTGLSTMRVPGSLTDLMNDDDDDRKLAQMSFGPALSDQPDASPLLADLSGLPPVWISAATNEVLLDDTLLLIRRLGLLGISVEAHIEHGLCHLWMLWPDALPQFAPLFDNLAKFLLQTR